MNIGSRLVIREKSICRGLCGEIAETAIPYVCTILPKGIRPWTGHCQDRDHVWSLPFINGGQRMYDKDPYLPVTIPVPGSTRRAGILSWTTDPATLDGRRRGGADTGFLYAGIWTKEEDGDFTVGVSF